MHPQITSRALLQAIFFGELCMTGALPGTQYVSVTSGVGTAYPSGAPEFTQFLVWFELLDL